MNVQVQQSSDSCGLFAIAMAYDICSGRDPCNLLYEESLMRNHLKTCFELRKLSQFPGALRSYRRKVFSESVVKVFCTCRYSDDDITDHLGGMVCCDNLCVKSGFIKCALISLMLYLKGKMSAECVRTA